MNGSYYSEEDDFPSPSPSQENSTYSKGTKGKKKKRPKRSTVVKNTKKKSATTTDTNNFLKDINNILDDKDASVLQNPKSSRMSLSINRNIDQANIINHANSTNSSSSNNTAIGPTRGATRHSIVNTNAIKKTEELRTSAFIHTHMQQSNKDGPPSLQEHSGSGSRSRNEDEDEDAFNNDDGPSKQALAMRDKFRQERLAKEKEEGQVAEGAPLPDRRATARERLRTTVLNIKSSKPLSSVQPSTANPENQQQGQAHQNPSIKRNSVAPLPSKRFSVALPPSSSSPTRIPGSGEVGQGRKQSVNMKSKDSSRRPSSALNTRQQLSEVYSSSSSDHESDYYDSSSESESESEDDDDDDSESESDSEDFDIQPLEENSLTEESIGTVVDPKMERSKEDPLIYDMLMMGDGGVGKTAILTNFITDSFSPEYNSTRGIDQHHSTLYMGQKKMLDRGKLKKRHVHVKLNIWDIGSRLTKHSYIKNSYILNSIIVFVVYDITNLDSYMSAIETIRHVRRIKYDQMIVLVGNKADNSTIAADDDDFDSDEDEDNIVVAPPPPTGLRRFSMIGSRRGSVAARQQVQPVPFDYNYDMNAPPPVLREIAKREAALEALRLGALFFETSAKTGHNIYILFNEVAKILVHKRRKLLFKIEAGIKAMQEANDEHSSDFESSDSDTDSDDDDLSDDESSMIEEGKSLDMEDAEAKAKRLEDRKERRKERKRQRKLEKEAESSSDDDSVLSAMSDWSDEDGTDDDDYVDVYGWGGKKKTEKETCTIM